MKNYLFLIIITVFLSCQKTNTVEAIKDNKDQIIIGQIDILQSDILDEEREIWVYLPQDVIGSELNGTKYPVLYLLDGDAHFHSVTGMIKQLSTGGNTLLPEMIVIAIPNTDRTRDLTPTNVDVIFGDSTFAKTSGGGNKFLDFLEKELIPYVEKEYPVSNYKTFVGHSFGGLAVINTLLNRPTLFNNYVAIDPSLWWDDKILLNNLDSLIIIEAMKNKSLFVGIANTLSEGLDIQTVKNDTTDTTNHIRSILKFVETMDSQENNEIGFGWKYYSNDSHGSVPLITEYDAFRFLFNWYEFKDLKEFYNENSTLTKDEFMQLLNSHYANISLKLGYTIPPSEQLVNNLGYLFMGRGKSENAFSFFDLNIQNFPHSANVYDSMGDYYVSQSDTINAIKQFSIAVEKGDDPGSLEKLKLLKLDE